MLSQKRFLHLSSKFGKLLPMSQRLTMHMSRTKCPEKSCRQGVCSTLFTFQFSKLKEDFGLHILTAVSWGH
jgi:hypothetical protein